jgi:Asp-tRNA(Asn)/Glu-tRNA(Gln) amidotransferase A subunit family amidase
MSLQVVGRHFADDLVLAVAHLIEQAIGDRSRRPAI